MFVLRNLNTSIWMNFSSNPSLKDIFNQFDLKIIPKGRKTFIWGSQNS